MLHVPWKLYGIEGILGCSCLSSNLLLYTTEGARRLPMALQALLWLVPRFTVTNEEHFIANVAKKSSSMALSRK